MSRSHEHASRDTLEAMHIQDDHVAASNADVVPPGELSGHSKSHAAHQHVAGTEHTKPEGNLRQGSDPGALRQPPQEQSRVK